MWSAHCLGRIVCQWTPQTDGEVLELPAKTTLPTHMLRANPVQTRDRWDPSLAAKDPQWGSSSKRQRKV